MNIDPIQKTLVEHNLDGWLLYDFRRSNPLACQVLQIPGDILLTRRFFYWIPATGEPIRIVHGVESSHLDYLPGGRIVYRTWQELKASLEAVLEKKKIIAMEYSPDCAIPTISKVDGGTLDLVRSCGVTVASSADLLQVYTSVWTERQLELHREAALVLCDAVDSAWKFIRASLDASLPIDEYAVQQHILKIFSERGCITSDPPICAVNAHSADPHYSPPAKGSAPIIQGDFILIDSWCKRDLPDAVYADITRVGVAAKEPSERQQEIFTIVKQARDAATDLVRNKTSIQGWEVDQAARDVIDAAGYGEYFVHRTGHNIGKNDHGDGANIDNFETQDLRQLLPGTCFSIEPGIYLPGEFGVRLEYDLYLHRPGEVEVTGGVQDAITCLVGS